MFKIPTFIKFFVVAIVVGLLWIKFVYPDLSKAEESLDINKTYHLPAEQVQEWMKEYSPEEVETLIQDHIDNQVELYGAEPLTIHFSAETEEVEVEESFKDIVLKMMFDRFLSDK